MTIATKLRLTGMVRRSSYAHADYGWMFHQNVLGRESDRETFSARRLPAAKIARRSLVALSVKLVERLPLFVGGFPSETKVKRGVRVVHGDKELEERVGRNDLCPCGSGRLFKNCCRNSGCFRRGEPGPLLFENDAQRE